MEAFLRRKKMFAEELKSDIPKLLRYHQNNDFVSFFNFAHKYKMRLTYFNYPEALLICNTIEQLYVVKNYESILETAIRLIEILETIQKELNDESISG
jgi:HPt (histidine-containing phosphotransfer) domain-containing protein